MKEVYVKFKPNTETDMNKLLEWLFVNNITTKSYNRTIGIYPVEDKIFRVSVDLATNTITFGCFYGQRLTLPLEVIDKVETI